MEPLITMFRRSQAGNSPHSANNPINDFISPPDIDLVIIGWLIIIPF
ncbi:hypothetical protein [Mucilaginibacter sp. OK098]|nr:hypothetical protein [Mucilaginibacter sp. OK098]SHM80902.1 hypothetical protein SAMN05216524_103488 [Mucilaginibacter sp. OK098]